MRLCNQNYSSGILEQVLTITKALTMKKFILLALNCIALLSFGQGPDTLNYKNVLTLEPLAFFASGLQLGYERQFATLMR